ncbi:hypothetical protein L1049_012558 [Liquidambar formosana]|uniref:Uncharacterized protein n=1 Tax=Liquidambar formosana TaxID=63359 RepID=A0AAP0R3H9_LIQFO
MSPKCSLPSYKLGSIFELLCRYRSLSSNRSQGHFSDVPVAKLGHGYSMHKGLQLIGANSGTFRKPHTNMVKDDKDKVQPPAPPPPRPPSPIFPIWARWVLGSILSLLLSSWKQKWDKLQRIEGEAQVVVEEVENVAEVVEKVATVAEKISVEVADKLPDNGKLKEAALLAEQVSAVAAKDAQQTIDFIHKVDALKHDLEDLETTIEPIIDKIATKEFGGK